MSKVHLYHRCHQTYQILKQDLPSSRLCHTIVLTTSWWNETMQVGGIKAVEQILIRINLKHYDIEDYGVNYILNNKILACIMYRPCVQVVYICDQIKDIMLFSLKIKIIFLQSLSESIFLVYIHMYTFYRKLVVFILFCILYNFSLCI